MSSDPFADALVLTGPTGSGKSFLGVELAERLGAEIISMDSMTLYRTMDIGTAKPGPELRRRVPHHLIDVLDPWESSSVAWWLEKAAATCRDIEARGKRVLFVGGTPLYLKALCHGLFEGPAANPAIRQRLYQEAAASGRLKLHRRLAGVDAKTAARLHPNDLVRVVRALEVWELTGRPISDWQRQWTRAEEDRSKVISRILCLEVPRADLYRRIDSRVTQMMENGFVEEVRALRNLERPVSKEAARALGYKEVFAFLDGETTFEEAIGRVQTRSRNLAKRQLTWFRHLPECRMAGPELTFSLWGLKIN